MDREELKKLDKEILKIYAETTPEWVNSMNIDNITTSSSTTSTGTTYSPEMIEYWKNNPRPQPEYVPNYIDNVGQLIKYLEQFPSETKVAGCDEYGFMERLDANNLNIREAEDWDAQQLFNGQIGDKYIIL